MIVVVHDENENENDNDPSKKKMVRIKGPKIKISMNTELYVHDKKKSGSKSNISDESGRNGDGTVVPLLPPVLILFHKPKNVLSIVPPLSSSSSSSSSSSLSSFANNKKSKIGKEIDDDYNINNEIDDNDEIINNPFQKKINLGDYLTSSTSNNNLLSSSSPFDLNVISSLYHQVGRLDYDSSGLILFSRNGDLTNHLLHPSKGVEREYVATVSTSSSSEAEIKGKDDHESASISRIVVDEEALRKRLKEEGVRTTEGLHYADVLDVREVLSSSSSSSSSSTSSSSSSSSTLLTEIRLIVREGKHRMVRRMLANCGYPVIELKRERHGIIKLGDLKVGTFRGATMEEVDWANKELLD